MNIHLPQYLCYTEKYQSVILTNIKVLRRQISTLFSGGNVFCGGSQFFNYKLPYELYQKWFFQVKMCHGVCFHIPKSSLCSLCLLLQLQRLFPELLLNIVNFLHILHILSSSLDGCILLCHTGLGMVLAGWQRQDILRTLLVLVWFILWGQAVLLLDVTSWGQEEEDLTRRAIL